MGSGVLRYLNCLLYWKRLSSLLKFFFIDHVLLGYVKPDAPPTILTYQPGLVALGLYNDPLVSGRIQLGAGVGCV
jgi:hypothetical protein